MFKELPVFILVSVAFTSIFSPIGDQHLVAITNDQPFEDVDPIVPDVVMDIPLRMSKRVRRPVISDDYIIYL